MTTPILTTKLYRPPPRPELVQRTRLLTQLNAGLRRRITLISAPAGFGKTTLVSSWLGDAAHSATWVSLDEGDNDLTRFLNYLVNAIQTMAPQLGTGVLTLLQSPQPPPIETILTALLNDLTTLPETIILILDDYHVIESAAIHEALTFLIEHLPPQLHLVITTREDPPLPLARLRVRGHLTELRAADLRFTLEEATTFLNQMMGLKLTPDAIVTLDARTEGWIAGLQLAALSLQGQPDPTHFITSFTGSHRFVLDYLVEEVLSRQPEHIQTFLLYTSILNRLSGRLCEALLNNSTISGQVTLEYLERANLLVIPLDDQRQWYRYHHLFADVLQTRLMQEHAQQMPMLHQRASTWYEHHDLPADAIHHAFAAKDFERAAGLIELAGITMRSIKQEATMLGWVKQLPDQLIRTRPVLSVVTAWALLDGGELEAAESRLQDAERWLNTTTTTQVDEMVVVDEVQFRSLRASIANARAYRAQALGDIPGTVMHARYAIDFLPEDAYYERGTTTALLGIAYWASGELEAAYQSFANGLASLQMGGGILIVIGGTIILAHIRIAQGRLHDAISICKQSLQLATEQGAPILRGTAELYMGLSELYCEQGDLETATQYLRRGETLREQASLPGYEYFWCIAQARLKEAHDDLDGAMERLHEAERLYYKSPIPDVRPIAALKARVWIKQGKLAEALGWAHNHNISVDDELSYLHEYEHVTLARIRIAQYRHDRIEQGIQEALGLLERLLRAAEAGKRNGSIIEILVLQALTHEVQGHSDAALEPLERALTLAEPESYIRIFVDEGPPMALLLQAAAQQRIAPNYVARLRAAFGAIEDRTPVTQHLVEPLSEREIDVLRLLGTELSGPDIARELVVSLNTLRTHTKNIYSKLGVSNRRAAVRRAEELHLL